MRYFTLNIAVCAIVLIIDALWLLVFFRAYLDGGEVSGFFFIFMFAVWYIFNLLCTFLARSLENSSEGEEIDNETVSKHSLVKRVLTLLMSSFKYLTIALVNITFIVLVIYEYRKESDVPKSFPIGILVVPLIYNLLNFWLIHITRNIATREFYRFLLIVAPVVIFLVWFFIV